MLLKDVFFPNLEHFGCICLLIALFTFTCSLIYLKWSTCSLIYLTWSTCSLIYLNWSNCSMIYLTWSTCYPDLPHLVHLCPDWPHLVHLCPEWAHLIYLCPDWPQLVHLCPDWSHLFNPPSCKLSSPMLCLIYSVDLGFLCVSCVYWVFAFCSWFSGQLWTVISFLSFKLWNWLRPKSHICASGSSHLTYKPS